MRSVIAALAVTGALLALSACGQKADLKPQPGKRLPPAPYGTDTRKSAEELLAPPVQAASRTAAWGRARCSMKLRISVSRSERFSSSGPMP